MFVRTHYCTVCNFFKTRLEKKRRQQQMVSAEAACNAAQPKTSRNPHLRISNQILQLMFIKPNEFQYFWICSALSKQAEQ